MIKLIFLFKKFILYRYLISYNIETLSYYLLSVLIHTQNNIIYKIAYIFINIKNISHPN